MGTDRHIDRQRWQEVHQARCYTDIEGMGWLAGSVRTKRQGEDRKSLVIQQRTGTVLEIIGRACHYACNNKQAWSGSP